MPTLFPFVTMMAWRQFSRLACALYKWRLVFLPLYLLFLITAPAQADLGSNVVQFGTKDENSTSLAWGDWDGDGDLDLAVGNAFSVNQVYENDAGQLKLDPTQGFGWRANVAQWTTSVAWGDWDGDGDLDLAVGNKFSVNQVYENDAGQLKLDPAQGFGWQADEAQETTSLAWGDWDGDGDLDLAVGNKGNNRVYENEAGTLQWTPANSLGWEASEVHETNSLAWGDWDKDGDLDLAVGNYNASSQVYENVGGTLHLDPAQDLGWQANAAQRTYSVAWGDWDNDRDLDLAFGNRYSNDNNSPSYSTIYENEAGQLRLDQANGLGAVLDLPAHWLAWGDVDLDGDLDLAGNSNSAGSLINVFENHTVAQSRQLSITWQSDTTQQNIKHDNTLAWGDWDSDGDLDLAVGNNGINLLYQNEGQNLNPVMQHANGTKRMAWGDWDGDHDLDLALGNRNKPTQVYENTGGNLELLPTQGVGWQSSDALDTRSVAWGDWDNDGDLDLAVGNHNAPNQVYENNGETLTLAPLQGAGWQAIASEKSTSVAWGDWDDDGDLDLAVGNDGFNRVYENADGTLQFDPVLDLGWQAQNAIYTYSVAWGDWDDDGDLDLAVGTATGVQVYANQGATLTLTPAWFAEDAQQTDVVAWGDWDGDGDLDLAAGGSALRVYENEGGKLRLDTAQGFGWQANDGLDVRGVAWGDWDGDGDLDLSAAGLSSTVVYENIDGDLRSAPANGFGWRRQAEGGNNDIAWADWDGDGDLELVKANNAGFELFENPQQGQHTLVNNPPVLTIKPPASAPNANFYAMSKILADSVIAIPYMLSDDEGDPVGQIRAFYSVNGGGHWTPAVATSATMTTNLIAGEPYFFYWDTAASGFFGQSDQVVVRLEAYTQPAQSGQPGQFRYVNTTPGFIQRPAVTAVTLPFRVRGTQVRVVDEENASLPGALVYWLPAGQFFGATPLADLAGQPFRTNGQGYLSGRGALQQGDGLVALLPVTPTQPITFTKQYSYFLTSAAPTVGGLALTKVRDPGVITLTIPISEPARHPLLLFHLLVSLEWDASDDELFRLGLEEGFKRAAELLFDVTDGQVAIGRVDVLPAKSDWNRADLILYASNSLRPSAAIGGVVNQPVSEFVRPAFDQPPTKPITNAYLPGQIRMGVSWDPFGEEAGDLSEQWWRALAHELAHHLLFLPDNYLGFKADDPEQPDRRRFLGRVDCQGSFMTTTFDPSYTEFLQRGKAWADSCLETLAEQTTARPDWATITHFYPMLKAPATPQEGPNLLPLAVTRTIFWTLPNARPTLPARYFQIRDSRTGEVIRLPTARVYLFQTQDTADPTDDLLLALGSPTGGGDRIKVRGGQPKDRLCLFDFGASDGKTYTGCIPSLSAANVAISVNALDPAQTGARWAPTIDVQAITTRTFAITVTQILSPSAPLKVQLFPAHYPSAPALAPVAALTLTNGVYVGQVQLPYPASDVAVRVWVEGRSNLEAISQFNLQLPWKPDDPVMAGPNTRPMGGPNTRPMGGTDYPIVGGTPHYPFAAPALSADAQVVIYNQTGIFEPNGIQSLQILPSSPEVRDESWLVLVGQAYFVQPAPMVDAKRAIAMTYLQRDVPEGYEHTLTLYFLPQGDTHWQRLPTQQFVENLLIADLQPSAGTYAIMSTIKLPEFHPGLNLFTYPLADTRPVTTALASLAGRYSELYEVKKDGILQFAPTHLVFGHTYLLRIQGSENEEAILYLAPPRRLPDGTLPGMQ